MPKNVKSMKRHEDGNAMNNLGRNEKGISLRNYAERQAKEAAWSCGQIHYGGAKDVLGGEKESEGYNTLKLESEEERTVANRLFTIKIFHSTLLYNL